MKNTALLVFILSFLLVSCGDDSGSSAGDSNEEAEIFSSSSSKANKSTKFSSSSSVKNKSSSSSSKKAETITDDIQNWKDTTEGAIRKGNVTDVVYIFDNQKWRVATIPEASLGGCNEKNVGNFGYADSDYHPNFYICQKDYDKKFYWSALGVSYYNHLCNDSSYYANSKEGDAHWGSIEPVKKKCINCKQENIDYLENICKKRCYVHDGTNRYYLGVQKIGNGWRIGHASECALGFGGCTESRFGTIKEGPVFKAEVSSDYLGYELYIMYSYVTSIDSIKKRPYICRYPYSEGEDYFPTEWYIASDIDIELAPKLCDNWWGILISGKNNNKYVCDLDGFRIATQEEIEEGIACTEYNMYDLEKCGSELEKQTGMTCAEYMRLVEKCRAKRKE